MCCIIPTFSSNPSNLASIYSPWSCVERLTGPSFATGKLSPGAVVLVVYQHTSEPMVQLLVCSSFPPCDRPYVGRQRAILSFTGATAAISYVSATFPFSSSSSKFNFAFYTPSRVGGKKNRIYLLSSFSSYPHHIFFFLPLHPTKYFSLAELLYFPSFHSWV